MLFQASQFSPEFIFEPRTRAVLSSIPQPLAATTIGAVDLLFTVIRANDPHIQATLSKALRPGRSWKDLASLDPVAHLPFNTSNSVPLLREAFSAQALRALDQFDAVTADGGLLFAPVALEVLVHCILMSFDESERRALAPIDTRLAEVLFRDQVARALASAARAERKEDHTAKAPEGKNDDQPFLLPPQLGPSDDLTFRARQGIATEAFPFDGEPRYERLFDSILRVLHRRQANHVLLTGERGVGKSTLISELARLGASGVIPFLQDKRFVALDCRYVPPDESRQRLIGILSFLVARSDVVLCVDGLAALLRGEGAANNKAILLAALAQARFQLIGLVTPREYDELFSDDSDSAEFFDRVDVEEPDVDVALKILRHLAAGLTQKYQVSIEEDAVRQAVMLSANYILNDQLPAKALRILHRICEDIDFERSQRGTARDHVSPDDIVQAVSRASGVPEETLRGIAERSDYEQSLSEVIFGQAHAVREVATELGLIKAGMTDPNKPATVMMFLGQTGTGKTEMAKALARFYSTSKRLRTYTLGNCVEPHSVATIIGVPPGYVGNDQGGRLVNELNADPYCVFLLDEADKAHPDVLQPFLNLFDEGWVSDQRGVRAYANKSIFILTTNVGQRMIAEMVREGKSREEITSRMREALSQIRHTKSDRPVFTPEFLSRIRRIIVFNSLDQAAMEGICRKLIAEMRQTWLEKRGKRLEIPEELVKHIATQAHQVNEKSTGKEGGRIVRKLIAEWIEAPLQRQISERPGEYRKSKSIVLGWAPTQPKPEDSAPFVSDVQARFRED
jgi:ATP-dependent Clp protease ATP-binding subunit ClpA